MRDQTEYHARRAAEEKARAEAQSDVCARAIHFELAERHLVLAMADQPGLAWAEDR